MEQCIFNEDTLNFLTNLQEIRLKKSGEYASKSNVFKNFEEGVGASLNNTREGVLYSYMLKHMISIKDMIQTLETGGYHGHFDKSFVDEKIGDTINYLLLLRAMLTNRIDEYAENNQ